MQILNTLTVLALVVLSFALILTVPELFASSENSGRSKRLILLGGAAWIGPGAGQLGCESAGGLRKGFPCRPWQLWAASLLNLTAEVSH